MANLGEGENLPESQVVPSGVGSNPKRVNVFPREKCVFWEGRMRRGGTNIPLFYYKRKEGPGISPPRNGTIVPCLAPICARREKKTDWAEGGLHWR